MPLIGHALVGWATALESRPKGHGAGGGTGTLFVPVVIAAAYFPDAFAQLGLLAGWADASRAGHSLLLALVATPAVAAAVSAAGGFSYAKGLLVAGITIGLHDVLDILQSADRQPLWPLADRPFALARPLLPESPLGEAVVFGVLFLLYLCVARLRRRPGAGDDGRAPRGRLAWAGRIATAALVTLAVVTHGLRGRRESQLEAARASIEHGDVRAGLLLLADAARWPSTARAGRVDYLRAEAYAGARRARAGGGALPPLATGGSRRTSGRWRTWPSSTRAVRSRRTNAAAASCRCSSGCAPTTRRTPRSRGCSHGWSALWGGRRATLTKCLPLGRN